MVGCFPPCFSIYIYTIIHTVYIYILYIYIYTVYIYTLYIYIYIHIYNKDDLGLRSFLDTSSCYRLEKTCQLLNMVYSEISYEKTYIHICICIYIYTWFRATIALDTCSCYPLKKHVCYWTWFIVKNPMKTHIYIYMYMRIYIYIWFRATNIFGHLQLLPSW